MFSLHSSIIKTSLEICLVIPKETIVTLKVAKLSGGGRGGVKIPPKNDDVIYEQPLTHSHTLIVTRSKDLKRNRFGASSPYNGMLLAPSPFDCWCRCRNICCDNGKSPTLSHRTCNSIFSEEEEENIRIFLKKYHHPSICLGAHR